MKKTMSLGSSGGFSVMRTTSWWQGPVVHIFLGSRQDWALPDQKFSAVGRGRTDKQHLLLLTSEKCFKFHELRELREAHTGQK